MVDKDTRKILKAAEAQGFTWHFTTSGHVEVRKDGRKVTTFSGTPGSSSGLRQGIAHMRRAGFIWPPPR